jgi:hypothetical protein
MTAAGTPERRAKARAEKPVPRGMAIMAMLQMQKVQRSA